jgi:hypothetical protein
MRERINGVSKIYAQMHKPKPPKMDSRTLTLIGAALGGIGIALIVDAKKQMSYLKSKQETAAPVPATDTPLIDNEPVEAEPVASTELPKSEPVPQPPMPPSVPVPPPIKITIPKQLDMDMLPGESYAEYHRRIAAFASEYKEESSDEEDGDSSESGSETGSDYDSHSDQWPEPEPEPELLPEETIKKDRRSPGRLPPATPRQMASREANPALLHRLRRATAMTEEAPATRERPSAAQKPKQYARV